MQTLRLPPIPRKIDRKITTRESTAYHEAGHAVAMQCMAAHVQRVSIIPDGSGFVGITECEPMTLSEHAAKMEGCERDVFEAHAAWALAGIIAEKMATGRWKHHGAHQDYQHTLDVIQRSLVRTEDEVKPYFLLLAIKARDILVDTWPAVVRVAEALVERKTLDGDQFLEIYRSALRRAPDYARMDAEIAKHINRQPNREEDESE
jgi:ATP-dependent Zn protease